MNTSEAPSIECNHSNYDEYFEMCSDCRMTLEEIQASL
jgi:hypothetical protein